MTILLWLGAVTAVLLLGYLVVALLLPEQLQ